LVPKLLERFRNGEVARTAVLTVAEEDGCASEEVWSVLEALWQRGIVDSEEPGSELAGDASPELAAQIRYLALFTSRPYRVAADLARSVVDLFVVPELAARLSALLSSSGVGAVRLQPTERGARADAPPAGDGRWLAILVARSLEEDWLLPCNGALIDAGRSFIGATLTRASAHVGPSVIPRESACLQCVHETEKRLVPALPRGVHLHGAPPFPAEPIALLDLVAAVLALEAIKTLTGLFVPSLVNRRLIIEPAALGFESEPLFKLPRCPVCGRAATRTETEAFEMTIATPTANDRPAV
jgi:bacteriocin biosynthesis cyclodehydratase domain-containing protein